MFAVASPTVATRAKNAAMKSGLQGITIAPKKKPFR